MRSWLPDGRNLGGQPKQRLVWRGSKAVRAALDTQKLAALDLKMATERAEQAAADLAAAKRKLGVQVPIDEVVFIRSLPVRVEDSQRDDRRDCGHGSLLTVTDNQLAVDSSLPLDAAPLVKLGMPVAIDEQSLGIKATGSCRDSRHDTRHPRSRRVPHLPRDPR